MGCVGQTGENLKERNSLERLGRKDGEPDLREYH